MHLPVLDSSDVPPWYAAGLGFTCTQCGNCCTGPPGFVWISTDEITRLAAFLGLPVDQVVEKYCRKVGGRISLREIRNARTGEHDCIFLRESPGEGGGKPRRTCTVYTVRPLQCRTWPFWTGNLQSPQAWREAGRRCPGMNHGKKFDRGQIEALRDAEDWP